MKRQPVHKSISILLVAMLLALALVPAAGASAQDPRLKNTREPGQPTGSLSSIRYVKPGASGGCSGWADACELQTALGAASLATRSGRRKGLLPRPVRRCYVHFQAQERRGAIRRLCRDGSQPGREGLDGAPDHPERGHRRRWYTGGQRLPRGHQRRGHNHGGPGRLHHHRRQRQWQRFSAQLGRRDVQRRQQPHASNVTFSGNSASSGGGMSNYDTAAPR